MSPVDYLPIFAHHNTIAGDRRKNVQHQPTDLVNSRSLTQAEFRSDIPEVLHSP